MGCGSGTLAVRHGAAPIATLRDVAKRAGLSPATVSRALSGHPYVDDDTRSRALRAARELGYRPNALARALRVQSTQTIGLIIPDIRNDFFAESATVLQGALEERGYRLILCISNGDPAHDRSYLRTLVEHRVDGIVHVPSSPTDAHELEMGATRTALVELLRHSPQGRFDAIVSDDREGAAALTRHLLELGHRRIAMLTGPSSLSTTRYRVEGYRAALRDVGLNASDEIVLYGAYTPPSGYAQTREVLHREPRPTALFSSGSPLTSGVLRALADAKLRVPADLSLVAYEDPEWYAVSTPALTCYALPLREMGRVAAELITVLARGDGEERTPTVLRFSGHLVVRDSTAPPAVVSASGS
ncbi:MAG TPA: LacI family DNA-binding transcriptional regulator [Candidatus Acidoferrum sp.]|nr:LacI family DNA-binding transcriptional regulator [Candidatus Acidoferrum sp.]